MKIKVFVVVDTNVLVSAMYSNTSPPFAILELIESHNVIPIFDKRMLKEYHDVLFRDKFVVKFGKDYVDKNVRDILHSLVKNGIYINDVEQTKKEIKDKGDIPFFEVKESSGEFDSMLVTGNVKHYPEDDEYVVTPKELLVVVRQMDRYVQKDVNYEIAVEAIVNTNIESSKYTSGENLLNDIFENVEEKIINEDYFEDMEL
jgi:putative PIN family toxin of toxin-antitoxin system